MRDTVRIIGQVKTLAQPRQLVVERVGSMLGELFKRLASVFGNKVSRILALRQGEDPQVHIGVNKQLKDFIGSVLSSLVPVQDQDNPLGQPFQDSHVLLAQCRSQHGDDWFNARLNGKMETNDR